MQAEMAQMWYAMVRRSWSPWQWFHGDGDRCGDGDGVRAMWVYREVDGDFEVGFYDPEGHWHEESVYSNKEDASNRVRWLNGGS